MVVRRMQFHSAFYKNGIWACEGLEADGEIIFFLIQVPDALFTRSGVAGA